MRKLVLLLAALVLVVSLPACGGEEEEQALPETVEGTLPTITPTDGFRVEGYHLEVIGHCVRCAVE